MIFYKILFSDFQILTPHNGHSLRTADFFHFHANIFHFSTFFSPNSFIFISQKSENQLFTHRSLLKLFSPEIDTNQRTRLCGALGGQTKLNCSRRPWQFGEHNLDYLTPTNALGTHRSPSLYVTGTNLLRVELRWLILFNLEIRLPYSKTKINTTSNQS